MIGPSNVKLSVVVPVYNTEVYLPRCVESILSQTYSNIEVILVDDGSTDKSPEICDRFSQEDRRVRVIHKPNGGVSSARNVGIETASGDYVAFVDSDDFIDVNMYEKLFCALFDQKEIAICDCMLHYADKNEPRETIRSGKTKHDFLANFFLSDIGGGSVFMIVKKTMLDGLRFPEHLHCGEDSWLMLRLLAKATSISKVNEPLYYYNLDNSSSITHSLSTKSDAESVGGMEENRQFLIASGLFPQIKKYWYWSVVRFKSTYIVNSCRFSLFRTVIPEANRYILSCPLVTLKMKLVMMAICFHVDSITKRIVSFYCR